MAAVDWAMKTIYTNWRSLFCFFFLLCLLRCDIIRIRICFDILAGARIHGHIIAICANVLYWCSNNCNSIMIIVVYAHNEWLSDAVVNYCTLWLQISSESIFIRIYMHVYVPMITHWHIHIYIYMLLYHMCIVHKDCSLWLLHTSTSITDCRSKIN